MKNFINEDKKKKIYEEYEVLLDDVSQKQEDQPSNVSEEIVTNEEHSQESNDDAKKDSYVWQVISDKKDNSSLESNKEEIKDESYTIHEATSSLSELQLRCNEKEINNCSENESDVESIVSDECMCESNDIDLNEQEVIEEFNNLGAENTFSDSIGIDDNFNIDSDYIPFTYENRSPEIKNAEHIETTDSDFSFDPVEQTSHNVHNNSEDNYIIFDVEDNECNKEDCECDYEYVNDDLEDECCHECHCHIDDENDMIDLSNSIEDNDIMFDLENINFDDLEASREIFNEFMEESSLNNDKENNEGSVDLDESVIPLFEEECNCNEQENISLNNHEDNFNCSKNIDEQVIPSCEDECCHCEQEEFVLNDENSDENFIDLDESAVPSSYEDEFYHEEQKECLCEQEDDNCQECETEPENTIEIINHYDEDDNIVVDGEILPSDDLVKDSMQKIDNVLDTNSVFGNIKEKIQNLESTINQYSDVQVYSQRELIKLLNTKVGVSDDEYNSLIKSANMKIDFINDVIDRAKSKYEAYDCTFLNENVTKIKEAIDVFKSNNKR